VENHDTARVQRKAPSSRRQKDKKKKERHKGGGRGLKGGKAKTRYLKKGERVSKRNSGRRPERNLANRTKKATSGKAQR